MRTLRPILLVEDDTVDVMTVKRVIQNLGIDNMLVHASDGQEALEYLSNGANKTPCLIVLDLNMPKMNGIEFLRAVKAEPVLRTIPVIVLTTSNREKDKIDTFDLNVAGYVVKPADCATLMDAFRTIDMYWTLSELPNIAG